MGGGVPEMLDRAAGVPLLELTLRVALGEEIRIDGPVATERIGYRFFLQPPAVSATVAAIDGIDAVSDHPGVDTISVHQGPGADLDWRDGSRNHIMAVVGSAAGLRRAAGGRPAPPSRGHRHLRRCEALVAVRLVAGRRGPARADRPTRTGPARWTCAFVNNMPDGAFDATERQFLDLLDAGSGAEAVEVRRYTMAGVPRGERTAARIAERVRAARRTSASTRPTCSS